MKTKKVMRECDAHGSRHVTPAGRSVFYDLFPKAEADELVMRSTLVRGLERWLKESGLTQTEAAKLLGITQARVSDIKRGKFGQLAAVVGVFGVIFLFAVDRPYNWLGAPILLFGQYLSRIERRRLQRRGEAALRRRYS